MAKERYQPHIDGIRALAILAVILYHAFPTLLPGGFVGVDVFFVISGYLISGILIRAFTEPAAYPGRIFATFYGRRIRRLFPSLLVVLVAAYLLGFRVLLADDFAELGRQILAAAGFCLNFVLAGKSGYFDAGAADFPLLHLWSLCVEEQFYLIWPLAIWICVRGWIRPLPLTVFLLCASFFLRLYWTEASPGALFFLPQMRLWEPLAGALLAWLSHLGDLAGADDRTTVQVAGFGGLTLVIAGVAALHASWPHPVLWLLIPIVGTLLLILSGPTSWVNRRILSQRLLVGLGLISYPLYLWHWVLFSFARIGWTDGEFVGVRVFLIVASIMLAWATYAWVEAPLRHGRRPGVKIALLIGAMTLLAGFAAYTWQQEGFPTRFPPLVEALARFSYDPKGPWRYGSYLLHPSMPASTFGDDRALRDPTKPTLYLWGDSHAAQLYPGFHDLFGSRYNIAQRTVTSTPPFLGKDFSNSPGARALNDFIFASIKRDRPDTVVLAANWCDYPDDWPRLARTIAGLRSIGIVKIVVIGPVPQWPISLPQIILNYLRQHPHETVPERMATPVLPSVAERDLQMESFCHKEGVGYESPYHLLINGSGFLVRTGDSVATLTSFDSNHLTRAGSDYLVSHFANFTSKLSDR